MNKSLKLKRKTMRLLAKNLIVFAVLIAVTIVGVRSWFHSNEDTNATANGINVKCSVPEGMEVAIIDPTIAESDVEWEKVVWHSESFTISDEEYPFLSALSIADVSGDGIKFITPPLLQTSTVAHVNTNNTGDDADKWSEGNLKTTPNTEYFSINLYMRSKAGGQKAVLDEQTYCGRVDATKTSFGSKVAGYSPDAVIGAARVAILDPSFTKRELLWIPAPHMYYDGSDLHLSSDSGWNSLLDPSNTYGLNYIDENSQTSAIHSDGTYRHGYYNSNATRTIIQRAADTDTDLSNKVVSNTTADYKLHRNLNLANLSNTITYTDSSNKQKTIENVNKVRVNIWVEGEDPESRSAQISGEFKAVLSLRLENAS